MAQQKIRIRLKGYDHTQLDLSAKAIVETAQRTGATVSGPVPLPTEKNVYCVIRSPFKDKDSREHFEIRTHKRLIDIHQPTPEDGRLADAARPAGRRRHRDQAVSTKAIIGRKLGMTQIFTEDGRLTPATVIQAGPCPVVAVRTGDSDGYDAVQLAYEPVPARKINKPEVGHLAKVNVEPHRHLKEFRGSHGAPGRRHRDGRRVRAGRRDQGDRHLEGQGLRRHDQAPQLRERPQVARLAQRARAGLDRSVRVALARDQGPSHVRPHGREDEDAARVCACSTPTRRTTC